jgi:hypothetical protein
MSHSESHPHMHHAVWSAGRSLHSAPDMARGAPPLGGHVCLCVMSSVSRDPPLPPQLHRTGKSLGSAWDQPGQLCPWTISQPHPTYHCLSGLFLPGLVRSFLSSLSKDSVFKEPRSPNPK